MPRLMAVVPIALSLSLGCATTHTVCVAPVSSSSSCSCGSGACPIQFQADIFAAANGQIAGFPIQFSTGALGTPTTSAGPATSAGIAVIPSIFLFASNPQAGSTGSIEAWTFNTSTGGLTAVPGSPFSVGGVTVPAGLAIADNLGPAGPFLYVADAGKIDALQVDNGTGTLTAVPGSPFTSGTNPYLAVDPMNHFVFAADEDPPGSVGAFTINASTGALTTVPGSPFLISSNSSGSLQPGQIAVDPKGSFVYVAIPSTSQIAAFSISPSSGVFAVTILDNSGGKDLLYLSNRSAGTVSGYNIDPATGVLSAVAGSPFPIAADNLVSDSLGHLYASGTSGMMVFSINPSTGALIQIGSPVAFAGATALVYAGP